MKINFARQHNNLVETHLSISWSLKCWNLCVSQFCSSIYICALIFLHVYPYQFILLFVQDLIFFLSFVLFAFGFNYVRLVFWFLLIVSVSLRLFLLFNTFSVLQFVFLHRFWLPAAIVSHDGNVNVSKKATFKFL